MKRAELINRIATRLAHLAADVKIRSNLNLQDYAVHSETFFRDLLNLAFDYKLININIVKKNAQAIDLGDALSRIAIQVTSTNDLAKIKHTHKVFIAGKQEADYDRLIVLIIGDKKTYREKTIGSGTAIEISTSEDVWGVAEVLDKIKDLPLEKVEACADFLEANLRRTSGREAKEVGTLVRLIEVLSQSDEEAPAADNREDPDPEGKINDRFAAHADFLREQYIVLHELYGRALAEVTRQSEISHVQVRKLQIYLSNWSDRLLIRHGGDPRSAMDALVNAMAQKMGGSDQDFEEGAIRYYVTDQLIACNVFPNKVPLYA